MHGGGITLYFVAASGANHGSSVVVDGEHERLGLLSGVSEVLHEHESHVGHEVDRVVPDDADPRNLDLSIDAELGDFEGHGGHRPMLARSGPDLL